MKVVKYLPGRMQYLYHLYQSTRPIAPRHCPLCGYTGTFQTSGRPPRLDACCPSCGSLERHRLFWLWYSKHKQEIQPLLLHFAPEPVLERLFRSKFGCDPSLYRTADLAARADLSINIERIDLSSNSVTTVICNHVLEHVDDRKALMEIHRILRPEGVAILSVPIVEAWAQTYEDSGVKEPSARELHFGQRDHLRYYGRDFRDRLRGSGFAFKEVISLPSDIVKFGLQRGESFFVCRKARLNAKHCHILNPIA